MSANPVPLSRHGNVRHLNCRVFKDQISDKAFLNVVSAEDLAKSTMNLISTACDQSMPRASPCHRKKPVYWWTPDIAELRRKCHRLRRAAQRARNRSDANTRSAEHKAIRRELRSAINRSKVRCWKQLCQDVDNDPWGMGYKIVTQKLGARSPPAVMEPQEMSAVVNTLFPKHPVRPAREFGDLGMFPQFQEEELFAAIKSLKNRKAPGPDGIPEEVLRLVADTNPRLLLDMFNACLAEGVFFSAWKVARLVLIPKSKVYQGPLLLFVPCVCSTLPANFLRNSFE